MPASNNPLGQIAYRDSLKGEVFISDTEEGAKAKADEWLNRSQKQSIHLVGLLPAKTGKNVYVITAIYSDA